VGLIEGKLARWMRYGGPALRELKAWTVTTICTHQVQDPAASEAGLRAQRTPFVCRLDRACASLTL